MENVTVDQMFYSAWRDAGMPMTDGTGLNPEQTEECRTLFNRMINTWRSEGLLIPHVARKLWPIISGKGDYLIGPGGDIDETWPVFIPKIGFVLTGETLQPEYPLFPMTLEQWADWTFKQQTTNWSQYYFYEKSYPLGIIHFLYVPLDVNQMALYLEQPLEEITATGDELIDLRPAYQEAVETNLAKRIAARNPGRAQISTLTLELAASSLDQIRTNNDRPLKRTTDLSPGRNWRSNVYEGNRYGW